MVKEKRLEAALFEQQLEILNTKNMELAFERFVKKLCERVICPNLLEQTGPVAGGDGKVDTQTFPVSEQTKVLWYIGVNENAHNERWAFAISTQKDWRAKCRSDVRKIKNTDREYKKAFYITNVRIKSNQRSEIEDSLSRETDIDVRILDASWIVDQVFKNKYEQLAIDELSIKSDFYREEKKGANDNIRSMIIEEMEGKLRSEIDASQISRIHLEYLLKIAIFTKEMEKPVFEAQGLFDRAIAATKRCGTRKQLFAAHYQYMWAAYWWFEDAGLFREQLLICLKLAKEIALPKQWGEMAFLLCFYIMYSRKYKNNDLIDLESIVSEVQSGLIEVSEKRTKPSSSLISKAYIEILSLYREDSEEKISCTLSNLDLIMRQGEKFAGFPFSDFYELIKNLDDFLWKIEEYRNLLEFLSDCKLSRFYDAEKALLNLDTGGRYFKNREYYNSIIEIGKSLISLNAQENKSEICDALVRLSGAYSAVGLLWAARSSLLFSASMLTEIAMEKSASQYKQNFSYLYLLIIDLRLGNIKSAFLWWRLIHTAENLNRSDEAKESIHHLFDVFLAKSIVNMRIEKVRELSYLPDMLSECRLSMSRLGLLHALGHKDLVETEYHSSQAADIYLKYIRDVDLGLPIVEIAGCGEEAGSLKSSIMGCEISIRFPFETPFLELSETVLSSLEAFFSIFVAKKLNVIESRLDIEVINCGDGEIDISHHFDDSHSILTLKIFCSRFSANIMLDDSEQAAIQEWLRRLIVDIFFYITRSAEKIEILEMTLEKEKSFERAYFGASFVLLQSIFGKDAVEYITPKLKDKKLKHYKMMRAEPWDKDFPKKERGQEKMEEWYNQGFSEYRKKISHRNIKAQDLISLRFWDKTDWVNVGFYTCDNGLPVLLLLYKDKDAAEGIFVDLANKLGCAEKSSRLRISFIRHINKNSPNTFKIVVSEEFPEIEGYSVLLLQSVSQHLTLEVECLDQLEEFFDLEKRTGNCTLNYGVFKDGETVYINDDQDLIVQCNLNVIEAWKIGVDDIEAKVIEAEDDPIIPEGVSNPPILQVLNRINKK